MTKCRANSIHFPSCKGRKVSTEFSGGDVTSDGGVLFLREADRKLGLIEQVNDFIADPRKKEQVRHSQLSMLRQRIYGIGLGYEDLNDHDYLRVDPAIQTAVESDTDLASDSTLCRLESRQNRQTVISIHKVMIDQFIASFDTPPSELILDFDATDDTVHGNQEGRFFHGYYGNYCFLPLYVFCGDRLLVSYLRQSDIDGAKHAWAILSLLVKRFRKVWPEVRIIFRGDGGFCRHQMLDWCENRGVDYIVGIGKNSRLLEHVSDQTALAKTLYDDKQEKVRLFSSVSYGAKTWKKERKIVVKAEHTSKGANPRFIVTTLAGDPQTLYDKIYCARGDMENRIKEQQLNLFADRTSCHAWWPNQFRLLLSSLAYTLMEYIRRVGLCGTKFQKAQCGTIRLKLLKVGAVILRNTRRVRFLLSSAYPYQDIFRQVAYRLNPT